MANPSLSKFLPEIWLALRIVSQEHPPANISLTPVITSNWDIHDPFAPKNRSDFLLL